MYGYPYGNNYAQPRQDERIWVQNQTSAEAYLVAPNGFVRLWDSSEPVFYEKRADASGRPMALETYEYKRREPQTSAYIDKYSIDLEKAIKGLEERIEALEGRINESDSNDTRIPEV